jgi:succinate dehydrogenase/fumarate reductase cytochrome b subunit
MDLSFVFWILVYMLAAGALFGLAFFLCDYLARKYPSEPMAMFSKAAKVILVVVAVLVLMWVIISAVSGGSLPWVSRPRIG